jgi:hypothetical protein
MTSLAGRIYALEQAAPSQPAFVIMAGDARAECGPRTWIRQPDESLALFQSRICQELLAASYVLFLSESDRLL